MAVPSFIGAGAGVTIASGSAACTAAGSGVAVGDLVILQVLQDGVAASAVTYSAISGIANLAGTASSLTVLATDQVCGTLAKQHLRVGRATSTTCSVTVATTGDDLYYRLYVFRDVAAGTTLADILENGTAGTISNGSGATAAVADTGVVTLGADRLPLQFVGVDDDNPLGPFTGMTGGTWFEAAAEFATATGTDAAIQLQYGMGTSLSWLTDATQQNVGDAASRTQIAQQFTAANTETIPLIQVDLMAFGSPADQVTVEIQTDDAGGPRPSGTVVGTSRTFPVSLPSLYSVAVNAPVTSGTKYWIVVRRTGAVDAANYYAWDISVGTTYTGHVSARYTGTSWIGQTGTTSFVVLTGLSAGTINGGSYTMAAADNWGVIGFALKPAATGPATVTRSVALNATGLILVVGRETLARLAALNAVGAVTASGIKVTPGVTYERAAVLAAAAAIATVGRETLARTAALAATGQIVTAGISVVPGRAAIGATATITAVGRETLARSAAVTATAGIASAGREQLARQVAFNAAAAVSSDGQIAGVAVVARAAAVAATGTVSATGAVTHVRERAAVLTGTGTLTSVPQRAFLRAVTVSSGAAVATVGRKLLSRTAALDGNAAITTVAGGNIGQASLTAIGTITLSRAVPAGYITSTRAGRIAVIYQGQIPIAGLGGIEYPAAAEGELAVGTVGGIARTGG